MAPSKTISKRNMSPGLILLAENASAIPDGMSVHPSGRHRVARNFTYLAVRGRDPEVQFGSFLALSWPRLVLLAPQRAS